MSLRVLMVRTVTIRAECRCQTATPAQVVITVTSGVRRTIGSCVRLGKFLHCYGNTTLQGHSVHSPSLWWPASSASPEPRPQHHLKATRRQTYAHQDISALKGRPNQRSVPLVRSLPRLDSRTPANALSVQRV